MNNKEQKLKNIAEIAANNAKIPSDIGEYVLNYLTKSELKIFLRFYKNAIDKKRVYISAPSNLTADSLQSLKNIYKDRDIVVDIDPSLGAGIKIKERDTIIDFTFKKYIDDTIDSLKD